MTEERQAVNAIKFYESKSWEYDATWHHDFTKRFITYLDIQPGQHVLDLACGTGLLTFLEANAAGSEGQVVGVDVTPAMLAIAAQKKTAGGEKFANVQFLEGDILHLDETAELKGKRFDVITVASALVLLPDPKAAIEHWSEYLKPGGFIAADATHPRNLVPGMVLERVARRLKLPLPYNRAWSRSESTLKQVFESAGLEVGKVVTVENQAGYGKRHYDVEQWDDFFVENIIVKDVARTFANNDIRSKAQQIYKEEWEKLAIDGKVEEVDAVFLGIARKRECGFWANLNQADHYTAANGTRYTPSKAQENAVFNGRCRCGAVQYTWTGTPSDITLCHCRACQELSGSGFLPFIDVSKQTFSFAKDSTLKVLHLSERAERTFCSGCGSPISMFYFSNPDVVSLTMATVNLDSMGLETIPKVTKHIYLREKAPWVVLPDDGTERWATYE